MPAGLNPGTCGGRTASIQQLLHSVSHIQSLSTEWLLTWEDQSAVLLAAGMEKTKEHNHTNHNHPSFPLPASTYFHQLNEEKRKISMPDRS